MDSERTDASLEGLLSLDASIELMAQAQNELDMAQRRGVYAPELLDEAREQLAAMSALVEELEEQESFEEAA